ncbi:MAG: rhomboid family intramembrane serine protease [Verrucomicrobiae bacterium]|nr:rhomboid family intramembrane serine protease [Verrucomicrobiae bacterium]
MIPLRDHNPTRTVPFVTVTLIIANAAVFLYQMDLWAHSERAMTRFIYSMSMVPTEVTHDFGPAVARSIFTSMFIHGGFFHIAGNMLYLWVFGNNVEDSMGHSRFIVFYLLCGVAAATGHVLVSPDSTVPTMGASGAISGVLGAYLLLFPRARIDTWIPVWWLFLTTIEVRAFFFLFFWFLLQVISGLPDLEFSAAKSGVAWWAHIGGFVAGAVLIPIFKQRNVRLWQ